MQLEEVHVRALPPERLSSLIGPARGNGSPSLLKPPVTRSRAGPS